MYNKNNIAILKVASKSGGRFQAVAFYGDRTVATDSFRMVEMSATGKAHPVQVRDSYTLKKEVKIKKGETVSLKDLPDRKPPFGDDFPNVDQVFKQHFDQVDDEERYSTISLNAEYLEQVLALLKNVSKYKTVKISVPTGPGRPVLLRATSEDQTARALVMPHNK